MSDQPPTTPANPSRLGCLGALGIFMLLPGLCSLIFAIASLNDARGGLLKDPEIQGLWLQCFLVSAVGIALILFAIRRARRR